MAEAHTDAVTLIQRFGAAANLNIHLHCLVLDGLYPMTEGGATEVQKYQKLTREAGIKAE